MKASPFDQQTEAPRERETRDWWAVVDDDVRRVTGFSCAPQNPDMWWCPHAGYSMAEGHHLFTTEAEALNQLIAELTKREQETREKISANRLRHWRASNQNEGNPMKTVWKFPIKITDTQAVEMPAHAELIHVGLDPQGMPCVWACVDTLSPKIAHTVYLLGTGDPVPERATRHIGSFNNGPFVLHAWTTA